MGRWVGVLRALVPGVAGMTRMRYRTFLAWNVLGALVWAPTVVIGGYLAGNSFRRVERWLGQAGLVIGAVAVFGIGVWLAARWAIAHRERVVGAGRRLRATPVVRRVEAAVEPLVAPVAARLRPYRAFVAVIAAAMVVIGVTGWAFAETFDAVVGAEGIARLDRPVADWFASHRTGWLTTTMQVVSTVGGGTGAVVVAAIVGLVGWRRGRSWRPLLVMVGALGGAVAMSQAIKHLTGRPRPALADQVVAGFAFRRVTPPWRSHPPVRWRGWWRRGARGASK